MTGASSADAAVMTMPTGSQISAEGRVAPPETTDDRSNGQLEKSIEEICKIYIAENNDAKITQKGYM